MWAARSLIEAAEGTGRAAEVADRIEGAEGATYLDVAMGHVAAALELAAGDRGDELAVGRLSLAREAVHRTEDRVARAVVELAAASVSARLARPEADEDAGRAEHLLARVGTEAPGWKRAFALATRSASGWAAE